jgi:hypothetical protein
VRWSRHAGLRYGLRAEDTKLRHMGDLAVGVVLTAWLAASILGQISGKVSTAVRRKDPAGLVPNWSFFAPRPVTFDYHLLYRDELWDLTLTDWTEIRLVEPRRWWTFIWNPDRRAKKALFDSCSMLLRLQAAQREAGVLTANSLQYSVPHLMLLNYVSQRAHPNARGTQFILIRTFGPDATPAPQFVYKSRFYAIEGGDGDSVQPFTSGSVGIR